MHVKKIEAFVRAERLNDVKKALAGAGHRSMMHYDIWYRGTEKEITQYQADGITFLYDFMPKVKIELVAEDSAVEDIVSAICESAHTAHTGDGKIFVLNLEEAIRIQTRETGDAVL